MKRRLIHTALILNILLVGCTEPYPIVSENFEELLVVNATLTDSLQYHAVDLTYSSPLNSTEIIHENNAEVWIEDNNGQIFNFSQLTENAVYKSDIPFLAEQNKSYVLHITTSEGKKYSSSQETTPQPIRLENIYAERTVNSNGKEGIQVYAKIDTTQADNLFCRFDYTETYEIRTPFLSKYSTQISSLTDPYGDSDCSPAMSVRYNLTLIPRENDVNVCYPSENGTSILLGNQSMITPQTNISNFPVHFIEGTSTKLDNRYSILVKAYSETYNSFQNYLSILNNNAEDNVLSPKQPGFISGNIVCENADERVIGYFNVATQTSKRIFFNGPQFDFLVSNQFAYCEKDELSYSDKCDRLDGSSISQRRELLRKLQAHYEVLSAGGGTYTIAPPECSNCTNLGTNIKPDFWVD